MFSFFGRAHAHGPRARMRMPHSAGMRHPGRRHAPAWIPDSWAWIQGSGGSDHRKCHKIHLRRLRSSEMSRTPASGGFDFLNCHNFQPLEAPIAGTVTNVSLRRLRMSEPAKNPASGSSDPRNCHKIQPPEAPILGADTNPSLRCFCFLEL